MPNVLITGARAPVALDCARAFRAAGFQVHLADSVRPWAARLSRGGWQIHRLPPPRHRFAEFSRRLRELVAGLQPAMVVPTCEEVFYVSAALHGQDVKVFAPDIALLRTLHSKFAFSGLLTELGVAGPKTSRVVTPDALQALDTASLVLKPEYSRFGTAALIRPGRSQVTALRPSLNHPWVAQEFIHGEEISSWSALAGGRITAHVTYRPAWRVGHSASFAFEALDHPAVEAIAARIAAATGMTGHLGMDLIDTGAQVLPIECNPRAVSGLHLFDANADLARAMLGEGRTRVPAGRLCYLAPAMLLMGAPQALSHGRLSLFMRDWRRGTDAIGRAGDWPAQLGVLLDAGRFALLGLSRNRGASAQTTDDIEWNGEALP